MHDRWATDPENLLTFRLHPSEVFGNITHLKPLRLFTGNHGIHKLESSLFGVNGSWFSLDANSFGSHDHHVTLNDVRHGFSNGYTVSDDNSAVHFRVGEALPLSLQEDFSLQIR